MDINENNPTQTRKTKGGLISQSVDVRKGYNPQIMTQIRNDIPIREGYNAQQMVQTVNNSPSEGQQARQKIKPSDEKK